MELFPWAIAREIFERVTICLRQVAYNHFGSVKTPEIIVVVTSH